MSDFKASKSETTHEHMAKASTGAAGRPRFSFGDKATAGTIIGAHTLTHIYARGFYVVVPIIYQQLGLVPVQAGMMDSVRWLASGAGGMVAGPLVDMYRHRRGLFLGLSLFIMALGYFLVSLAPNYGMILLALAFAHFGVALWHPPGIGLLSERFPKRRGLLIALHRSSGTIGDTIGPPLMGLIILAMTWQHMLQAGLPVGIILSIALWLLLWNVGGHRVQTIDLKSNLKNLTAAIRKASRGSGILTLMAIKWSSKAKIDLLTIDGSPGGTGMSPWRMMEEWGMPSLYLHAAAREFCQKLADKGERVPDIAVASGFSSEDGVFKALALGAPFVKAVCMGRALMIPGMVGKNIQQWIIDGKLPNTVSQFGSTVEEIFVNYEDVKSIVGADEIKNIPLGAVGIYSYAEKLKVGLQQLMAGARCFSVPVISRRELMSLTEECSTVTGIPYLMDAYREEAMQILGS
ncbi:MFS transporter [Chloroflexota bacterium]